MWYTLEGGSGPGLLVVAGVDPASWGCKALGAWADLGASAARPRIPNQGASQKSGHNGNGTEAKMPVKAPERGWADLAPPI